MLNTNEFRVITWTKRDGIKSVSECMTEEEATVLVTLLREANPSWLHVEKEEV